MVPKSKNSLVRSISREVDWAWLAGIIDGEGNLQMTIKKAINGKNYFTPKLRISNTDVRMIKKISEIYQDLNVVWFYTIRTHSKEVCTWKDMLHIEVASQGSIKKIMNAVIPYLINKKEAAMILARSITWVQKQPKGGNTTSYDYVSKPFFQSQMEAFRKAYNFHIAPSETKRRARTVVSW